MTWILTFILVPLYVLGLFALAWWSDRRTHTENPRLRALVYGLSLAVFTGSPILLSSVGLAARNGWIYLAIYIGAGVAITLCAPLMRRIARIVKRENIVSIADLLSSRYGKSRAVGIIAASLSLLCSVPFLAQQLRGLSMAWSVVAGTQYSSLAVLVFSVTLAGFVILFGARHPTLTEHNRGLVRVIAVESLFKLCILTLVAGLGLIVIARLSDGTAWTAHMAGLSSPMRLEGETLNIALLGFAGIFCAPRQFYVGFVQLEKLEDLNPGRWLLLSYLIVGCALVVPIVVAGTILFHGQGREMYALLLPQQFSPLLSVLAFLGAFSCIAAPVTAETLALSAMISNELILPLIVRTGRYGNPEVNIGRVAIWIRRAAICLLLILGALYAHFMRQNASLSSMGTVTASGVLQFLPVLLGGFFWRRGHSAGAIAGLCGGFAVWLYAIAAPQFLNNFGMVYDFGLRLAQTSAGDITARKIFLSLAVNIALYVAVSLATRPRLIDRIQASAFIDARGNAPSASGKVELRGTVKDIKALVAQFLGRGATNRAFEELEKADKLHVRDKDAIDPRLVLAAERMLAGVIGASLARRVMGWQLNDAHWGTADMFRVLDDAAQVVQFNRELLQTTLDHMDQGVYVTDRDGVMVAWNRRYLEWFRFPAGFIRVGQSVREAIRFSLASSGQSAEAIEAHVDLRLAQIHLGIPYNLERMTADGQVLKIVGAPMPGGRYVTSYIDVTELRRAASALQQANEQLEQRVSDRTQELTAANSALANAKVKAERATNSQARFLAAASHDVLQPLQAARLFIGTVLEDRAEDDRATSEMLHHADLSIESADRLLRALLNLSRLEMGGLKPEVRPVDVAELLSELHREFAGVAEEKGLRLRVAAADAWVLSDFDLLRSVLQNLIGNAIRYTRSGSVLVGCRNDSQGLRFEIRDSGPGIAEEARSAIFQEFFRLPDGVANGPGAGLGLFIVERICKLLDHPLMVRSRSGEGSIFSVTVPRAQGPGNSASATVERSLASGLRVLYVENDAAVSQGMCALLSKFGAKVVTADSMRDAVAIKGRWDVVLADYHLEEDGNGLDLIEALQGRAKIFALLTANPSEDVIERAAGLNVEVIRKPMSALFLRTFLARTAHLAMEDV